MAKKNLCLEYKILKLTITLRPAGPLTGLTRDVGRTHQTEPWETGEGHKRSKHNTIGF